MNGACLGHRNRRYVLTWGCKDGKIKVLAFKHTSSNSREVIFLPSRDGCSLLELRAARPSVSRVSIADGSERLLPEGSSGIGSLKGSDCLVLGIWQDLAIKSRS